MSLNQVFVFGFLFLYRGLLAQQPNILVALGETASHGYFSQNVEVINTQTIESCSNFPAQYPEGVNSAVAITDQGKIVICGGYVFGSKTSDCNSYDNVADSWNIEPYKLEPARGAAVSVEIRPNEWLISGGDGFSGGLSDTKIFKNGQFFDGPDLPYNMECHSMVMLDTEKLFVTDNYSDRNFILDINTELWTEVAVRPYIRGCSSIGTFFNSSANEIQVAHVHDAIGIYSPRDDAWHTGLRLPFPLTSLHYSATIQQGSDSFILIAGDTNQGLSGDIYHFDENGFTILKENVLTQPREFHVAIPIPEDQFRC